MAVHEPVVVITYRTPEYIQLKENTMLATMCSGMLENRTLEDHGGQCCLTAMGLAATLAVLARSYYICGGEAETGIRVCETGKLRVCEVSLSSHPKEDRARERSCWW